MCTPVLYNQKDVRDLDVCTRGTIQQERHGEGYEWFLEKLPDVTGQFHLQLTNNNFRLVSTLENPAL